MGGAVGIGGGGVGRGNDAVTPEGVTRAVPPEKASALARDTALTRAELCESNSRLSKLKPEEGFEIGVELASGSTGSETLRAGVGSISGVQNV